MAAQRSKGRSRANGSRSATRPREGKADPDLHGREPAHDPDVFVDIQKVKVDEIYVDVEQLEAHLARASSGSRGGSRKKSS